MDKILIISNSGDFSPIAYRMMLEDVDVSIYIHSPIYKKCYNNIIPKVTLANLKKAVKASKIIIFDMNKSNDYNKYDKSLLKLFGCSAKSPGVFGPVSDKIKSMGKIVIGCSTWTENLEMDRYKGEQLAKKIGIKLPITYGFKTLSEGIKFLKKQKDKMWVFKPDDNKDLDLTYVEHFPGELIQKMSNEYKVRLGNSVKYILQEKIRGVEISTEGWFDGEDFVNFNSTLEQKKMMNADLGLSIGSQSNLVWVKRDPNGLLIKEIKNLKPYLKKVGYIGPVDINCIIDNKGIPNYLEFTPRFGYDALQNLINLMNNKVYSYFFNGFKGNFINGYSASERITIPPFPYANRKLLREFAKDVLISGNLTHLFIEDGYLEKGQVRCAGADGIIGACVGKGITPAKAWDDAYNNINNINITTDIQYRTDGKNKTIKRLIKLDKLGVMYG